jgi:hypothetical protein
MMNNQRIQYMKHLKTGVTTLFLMVLCYGVTVPTPKNMVKDSTYTVKVLVKKVK